MGYAGGITLSKRGKKMGALLAHPCGHKVTGFKTDRWPESKEQLVLGAVFGPGKAGLSEVTQLGQPQVSGTGPLLHRKQFGVASERSLRRIREELAGLSLERPFEFPKTPFWQAQAGPYGLARPAKFIERDQRDLGRPVPPAKNISLSPSGKSGALLRASCPERGALRNVINAGRDAVDADALLTNSAKADGEVVWS